MGLATMPSAGEGVLCVILVNTALSIAIVKEILRSILNVVGIHLPPVDFTAASSSAFTDAPTTHQPRTSANEAFIEDFRSRTPALRFDSVSEKAQHGSKCECECECSVCLTQFEPDSQINSLACGHVFHKVCVEKWLDYWNVTCPLCRTRMLPENQEQEEEEQDESDFFW